MVAKDIDRRLAAIEAAARPARPAPSLEIPIVRCDTVDREVNPPILVIHPDMLALILGGTDDTKSG